MLASSQRSNLLTQRSTSLAQPIKAGFISSPLPVPQHKEIFSDAAKNNGVTFLVI
jgi:hypothetical protein